MLEHFAAVPLHTQADVLKPLCVLSSWFKNRVSSYFRHERHERPETEGGGLLTPPPTPLLSSWLPHSSHMEKCSTASFNRSSPSSSSPAVHSDSAQVHDFPFFCGLISSQACRSVAWISDHNLRPSGTSHEFKHTSARSWTGGTFSCA